MIDSSKTNNIQHHKDMNSGLTDADTEDHRSLFLDDQGDEEDPSGVSMHSYRSGFSRATGFSRDTLTDGLDQANSPAQAQERTIAGTENRAVQSLRVVLIFTLMVLTLLACMGIYYYSMNTEKGEFESAFASQGLKVISGFQGDSFRKLQAMESLSDSFTSYANISGSTWPYVTMPNSATHFEPYLSLTNAASLLVMPIVGPRQRYEWETYAQENKHWIDQDLATAGMPLKPNTTDLEELEVSTFIKNYVGIDTSPNPWLVWWQYAPVIPNRFFVNFNRLAWDGFAQEVEAVQQGKATLSKTWAFKPGLDLQSTKDFEFTRELLGAGRHGTYESGEPIGYIHYPIFDCHNKQDRKTVAVLTATVYWKTYMQNILPETENSGIVCVIENTLGQHYSYKIQGPEAHFLGAGDLHDPHYTDLGISATYDDAFTQEDAQETGWYTGVEVDTDHISYRIHVYPSKELEDAYRSNKPILYATVLMSVFLVTVGVFLLYDFCVARRQTIVLDTALKSNAVVESLFPENVRDKIMDNAMEQQQKRTSSGPKASTTFLASTHGGASTDGSSDLAPTAPHKGPRGGSTIADLYEHTTVCFADLAGFTKWSSTRSPAEVFELLECLYGSFDRIALRRRVFKVETIGDCYMCVTGIPNPQKDHAVIMSRFARDCQTELHRLTHELAEFLGEDTKELEMRVGLHSGPTTGGVLRGDKGRFQLFGDTVNTASRMETNGIRGKIHVSQATADALTACGKGKWLVPREEKIEAKGKGVMQTYWVNVTGPRASSTSSTALFCDSAHPAPTAMSVESSIQDPEAAPTASANSRARTLSADSTAPTPSSDSTEFYDKLVDC